MPHPAARRVTRASLPGGELLERDLDAAVRELAAMLGWVRYHTWRSDRSPSGFPDLVLVKPPRLIFAELKSDSGKVTPEQARWLELLGRVPGAEVYTWRPRDLQAIAEVLAGARAGDGAGVLRAQRGSPDPGSPFSS